MVEIVGNIDAAAAVRGYARRGERLPGSRRAVAAAYLRPRNRSDFPCAIDPANAAVGSVGNVEIARGIYRNAPRGSQPRPDRRAAVAESAFAAPRDPGNAGDLHR